MTEEMWNERRAHLMTKLQLYQAQGSVLDALFKQAQAELQAIGDKWTPPAAEPAP